MKKLFKRTCVLLLVFAMFMSMCSNVFAAKLLDGENGKEIYFSWSYYKYDTTTKQKVPVSKLESTEDIYFARLSYLNNPSDETQVMRQFQFACTANDEIVTNLSTNGITQIRDDVSYNFDRNYKDGQLLVAGVTPSGFVKVSELDDSVTSVTNAALFDVRFKVNRAVQEDELKNLFKIAANERIIVRDVNEKLFTVIELPHFAASVKANPDTIYPTSTMEKIRDNLTYTYIDENGVKEDDVTVADVTVAPKGALAAGTSTVTVSYKGCTCDVDIEVSPDTMTGISIETQPQLEYTSGATLNLDALVVKGTWASGHSRELAKTEYTTSPAAGTELKVAHNGSKIAITASGYTVYTNELTVTAADISTAATIDAIGEKEYTGVQITPEPVVKAADGTALVKGTDYDVEYGTNIELGTNAGSVIIKGKGEYQGETTVYFAIVKATSPLTLTVNDSEGPVTISYGDSLTFKGNGTEITSTSAGIRVEYKTAGADDSAYTTYNNTPLNVGTYDFRAYRDVSTYYKDGPSTNTVGVTINRKNIEDNDVTITVSNRVYDGSAAAPTVSVSFKGNTLGASDYTLSGYEGFTDVTDNASVTITATGSNYTGSVTRSYKITPQRLSVTSSNFSLLKDGVEDVTYTGSPITPDVDDKITVGETNPITLEEGVDYTVTYSDNTNAGTGKITVTPVDGRNYTFDEFTVDFTIKPKQIKITSNDYDWVSYVIDDEIDGYDSYAGQQSPYFKYDGNMHGIKLQFRDDARVNEIKLETLINLTLTDAIRINAGSYTAYVTLELNEAYKTNYQLLSDSGDVVPARPLSKTWSIHKDTLTNLTPSDLNILCSELVGTTDTRNYEYSLSWLGEGIKPIPAEVRTTNQGSFSNTSTTYDPTTNVITFREVTAKAAGTTGDSFKLTLKFDNYNDLEVTVNVNYINKKPVNPTMEKIDATYGETYAPVVMLGDKDVTANCTFTYNGSTEKPTNAGTYTVVATYSDDIKEDGYPGHTGTATATLTIKKRPLTADVKHAAITYGDEKPAANSYNVSFKNLVTGDTLTLGTDYDVSTDYKKGDGAKDYSITITLKETTAAKNYTLGPVTGTLTVNPKSITAASVTISEPEDKTYTGHPRVQGVSQKDAEAKFETYDLSVTYENNINVGTATIIYKGQRNYTGEIRRTFKINPATITEEMITAIQAVTYTGKAQTPALTIKYNGMTLKEGTDYTVAYTNNTNAGNAAATVTGKGNYTSTAAKSFTINKAAMVFDENQTVFRRSTVTGEQTESLQTIKGVQGETLSPALTLEAPGAQGILASAAIDGTNVKFTITGSEGKANYKVKMTMPADGNYLDGEYTLKFEVADKNDVSGSITFPNGSSVYTGAPQTYEKATLNPSLAGTWTYTYTAVDGSGASLKDGLPLTVGTYRVVASFTNADNVGTANATFTITKATPPTPTEVKVDGEDKTLKDLEDSMRKDLGTITGDFTWRDSDGKELPSNTKIEANKEYEWTFTPTGKDAKNYFPIYGKTTPYVRDDLSWLPGVLGGGSTFNFRDVTRYDYFYSAVKWAAENGIASGTSRYTFSPDAVCTRAQTVTFLWRAAGSPMPSYRISPFTDVNYGDYYYNAVLWAVEQGITTGLTATTFGPDKTVTRGQVATFLYRAASAVKPNITNPFTDVKSTAYNYDAILWAYDNRITTGTSTMTFSPDAFCTRAQIVTFLYRFYQGR